MPSFPRERSHPLARIGRLGTAGLGAMALAGATLLSPLAPAPSLAQGTPGLMEFRWENNRDYRKLYFFTTDTTRMQRAEYYLMLRPKDRKTAILKLSISVPSHFDSKIDPKQVKLCRMSEGGMLKRTRCLETIPATIEVSENGRSIEIFPETPVSDKDTIGVYMNVFNPFNAGMYQFNALAQAPGDIPVSGYLGSWLIQIVPNSTN
ncbi:hypothetical protein L107_00600 [Cyanobium sp. Copco_Reservoir_LC18]|uniref:DUF2808 domain-containing protein n=1 Tax=Cyanobium sp. Copco_Reservoir_LC18 TaxID=1328305 RepID=UPI00135A1E7A|nr:DUF2808 domain-containing protein [Cyanobium sp. Copco_Reservoir_LC18]KAF0654973.1 hypothetical protein L107_00600 [Cyanobium sp. Copco_Reservoir_LC18]